MNALCSRKGRFAAGAAAAVVLGVASTAALAATTGGLSGPARPGSAASADRCQVPALPGAVVDIDLSDMGAMMGGPHGPMMGDSRWWRHMPMPGMMRLSADPPQVRAGTVSLRALNTGAWPHEVGG